MITYFCIYSILGHFMESTYISIIERKWYSSGLLNGPYIPLYGFGALILIFIAPYIQYSYLLTFIIGSFFMTILEYFSSIYLDKVFHKKIWDYSHHPLNLKGRICLLYSLIWGLLSIILINYIHPYLSYLIKPNPLTTILSLIIICIIIKETLYQKTLANATIYPK